MNILIVDDEVTALRDLARVLRDAAPEATVETADGAKKALASCRKQAFDVAFLDITMPDKDGLTLAKELKQLCPLLNIVMVTAYPQYALDAMHLYVSDYILKPARRDEVRRAMDECGPYNFIPCTTQGAPLSNFEGVLDCAIEEVAAYSKECFGNWKRS